MKKTMKKSEKDPKVKKTFVRDSEKTASMTNNKAKVLYTTNVLRSPNKVANKRTRKACVEQKHLARPEPCSTEQMALYIEQVKRRLPSPLKISEVEYVSRPNVQVTKKLNFHINDCVYKNLVEINNSLDCIDPKKDKKPKSSSTAIRRDEEPSLHDFYEQEQLVDASITIPSNAPKYIPIRTFRNEQLYKKLSDLDLL